MAKSRIDRILEALDLDWSDLPDDVADLLSESASDGANDALNSISLSAATDGDIFHRADQAAIAWARDRAAELVGMRWNANDELVENPDAEWAITDGTRELLRGTITEALENGWSADELRQNLRGNYVFSPDRAANIARSELDRSLNQGQLSAARESGRVGQKEWLPAEDACDICQANADQGPIDIDDDFESGDDAPGAHPSCRCSLRLIPISESESE